MGSWAWWTNVDQGETIGNTSKCLQSYSATKEVSYKYSSSPFNRTITSWFLKSISSNIRWLCSSWNHENLSTVNGQYNPTIQATTGEWVCGTDYQFSHVIQLTCGWGWKHYRITKPVGIDSDISLGIGLRHCGINTAGLSPGGKITIQHAFNKPGDYYFIGNASESAPWFGAAENQQTKECRRKYLGPMMDSNTPSQVLATVSVTGQKLQAQKTKSMGLSGWSKKTCIGAKEEAAQTGVTRTRNLWNTDPLKSKGNHNVEKK